VTASLRQATGLLVVAVFVGGCGGGFGSEQPAAPDTKINSYVALGDGFTAAPYAGSTHDAGGCLRSAGNYPALVAQDLGIHDATDVSCTGASTRALTSRTTPADSTSKVDPQLDAVTKDTDVVTVGFGIEDRDLLHRMFELCSALPCGTKVLPQTAVTDATAVGTALTDALRAIQARAPKADILVVGYPKIAPSEGRCANLPRLTQPELDGTNYVLDLLNRQVQSAARQTGSTYVDVAALSANHELCSADPWVTGKRDKPGTSVAFHPVAAEQRAVAKQIELLLKAR
jgi:hypothetical protein